MLSSLDVFLPSTLSDRKYISQPLSTIGEEAEQQHKNRPWVSLLEKSKKVLINNSTVTAIGQVNHVYNYCVHNPPGMTSGLRMLGKAVAHEAMHDSCERYPPPRCDLVENQETIGSISAWATDLTTPASVLWVTSPSGGDKSLLTGIAQTVAEQLDKEGCLAGSFFFDKDIPKRNRETALFPTLAYQIVKRKPEMSAYVGDPISMDPTLLLEPIATQFRDLITGPFRRMMHSGLADLPMTTVIIDALEDCSTASVQGEILQLFLAEVKQKTPIPLRFLIFSEPMEYIKDLQKDYTATDPVRHISLQPKRAAPSQDSPPTSINQFSRSPSPGSAMSIDLVSQFTSLGSAMSVDQVSHRSLGSAMSVDQVSHFSWHGSAMSVDQTSHTSVHRRANAVRRNEALLKTFWPLNVGTAPHFYEPPSVVPFAPSPISSSRSVVQVLAPISPRPFNVKDMPLPPHPSAAKPSQDVWDTPRYRLWSSGRHDLLATDDL